MRKNLYFLGLVLPMLFVLNACGGNDSPSWSYEGKDGETICMYDGAGFIEADVKIGVDGCTGFKVETLSKSVYRVIVNINGKTQKYDLTNTPFLIGLNQPSAFPTDDPISGGFKHTFNSGENFFLLSSRGYEEVDLITSESKPAYVCEISPSIFKYAYYDAGGLMVQIARGFSFEAYSTVNAKDLNLHDQIPGKYYHIGTNGETIYIRDCCGRSFDDVEASDQVKWGVSEYESNINEFQIIKDGVRETYIAQNSTFLVTQ